MRSFAFCEYGGPQVLAFLEVPDPAPGPGQLVVALRAAGVNPADVKVRSGQRQSSVPVVFPMAVGREASGVVVAVGSGVRGLEPGAEVFGVPAAGTGALAELVLVEAAATARRPAGLSWEQAACIPVAVGTACDVLDELALPAGSTLLVLGAGGGVGTAVVQLATARGVATLGVASAGKQALVARLGAEPVLAGDDWPARVRSLAPGGVAGVLDLVGGAELARAASLLGRAGRLVSLADAAQAARWGGGGVTRRRDGAVFTALATLAATGGLDILVGSAYPWEEAATAVAEVESGHATGNVVVRAPTELAEARR